MRETSWCLFPKSAGPTKVIGCSGVPTIKSRSHAKPRTAIVSTAVCTRRLRWKPDGDRPRRSLTETQQTLRVIHGQDSEERPLHFKFVPCSSRAPPPVLPRAAAARTGGRVEQIKVVTLCVTHRISRAIQGGYHLQGKNKWLRPSTFRSRSRQTWMLANALKIQFAGRQAAEGSERVAPAREQMV